MCGGTQRSDMWGAHSKVICGGTQRSDMWGYTESMVICGGTQQSDVGGTQQGDMWGHRDVIFFSLWNIKQANNEVCAPPGNRPISLHSTRLHTMKTYGAPVV